MPTITDQDNPIQQDYNEKLNNNTATKLNDAEQSGPQSRVDDEFSKIAAANPDLGAMGAVGNLEQGGSTKDGTIPVDLTPGAGPRRMNARTTIRRYGALGAVIGGITTFVIATLTTSAPLAVLSNFKEASVRNFDLTNITAEPRARIHMKNRLSGETNRLCATIPATCKYSRPSKKLMTSLDQAGIKYLDADGNPMEQQRVIDGERPVYYETPEGMRVESVNFANEIKNNPEFRSAFRRGYNPRWMNWASDNAVRFFGKYGMAKNNPDKIKNADGPDESAKEIKTQLNPEQAAADEARLRGEDPPERAPKDTPANQARIEADLRAELDKYSKSQGRRVSRVADNIFIPAVIGCALSGLPGVVSNVARAYRIAKAFSVATMFLTAADEIKAREATDKHISALAGNLTETGVDPTTGLPGRSALDAGSIKYLLFRDVGSAKTATYGKEMMPGRTMGSLQRLAGMANNPVIKTGCNVITSPQAGAAMAAVDTVKALKNTSPVGVALGLIDVAVEIANWAGWLNEFYAWVIQEGLERLLAIIDWQSMAETAFGDFAKSVRFEPLGDLLGVNLAQMLSLRANFDGDIPLIPGQAVNFMKRVQGPLLAEWAEEDRLNYSPLDASNPNTFLGSITTQMMPYMSSFSSISSGLSSLMSISSKSLVASVAAPNSMAAATTMEEVTSCEGDYSVETSGVAAGPVCNVFYGIPEEYLGLDPIDIIDQLIKLKQIDEELEIVENSDLENWKNDCNSGDMTSLGGCTITGKPVGGDTRTVDGEGESYLKALFALFIKDSGIIHDMDDEDPGVPDEGAAGAAGGGGTTVGPGGLAWPMDKAIFDANPGDWLDPHSARSGTWTSGTPSLAVDIGGNGMGTPVYAMLGGNVTRGDLGGHGLLITSQVDGGTVEIAYAHGPRTNQNATYNAGDQIMTVACLGNCGGPHLHIDIAFNGQGVCPQDVFIAMRDNQPVNWAELASRASAPCAGR